MSRLWFTADTHFCNGAVASERGFVSREEHDEAIVRAWNKTVGRGDHVWHLGNVGAGDTQLALRHVPRLSGKIHLVAGDQDAVWSGNRRAHEHQPVWMPRYFASIHSYAVRRIAGHDVMLSHFPYHASIFQDDTSYSPWPPSDPHAQFRLPDTGHALLHGHQRAAWKVFGRQINVGMDMWDMAPVPAEEVARLVVAAMESDSDRRQNPLADDLTGRST